MVIVDGVIFVMVVVWHTGIEVVFATWFDVATFDVANVFDATKLSASIRRRDSVGGAGTANEFCTQNTKNKQTNKMVN